MGSIVAINKGTINQCQAFKNLLRALGDNIKIGGISALNDDSGSVIDNYVFQNDISVIGNGSNIQIDPFVADNNGNIEGNIIIPDNNETKSKGQVEIKGFNNTIYNIDFSDIFLENESSKIISIMSDFHVFTFKKEKPISLWWSLHQKWINSSSLLTPIITDSYLKIYIPNFEKNKKTLFHITISNQNFSNFKIIKETIKNGKVKKKILSCSFYI